MPSSDLPSVDPSLQQDATHCNSVFSSQNPAEDNSPIHQNLTPRQLLALELLLQGLSDLQTAQQVGVSRWAIYRWRTLHPPFRAELERQRRQLNQHAADRLRALLPAALDVLKSQLENPVTALRAASTLLRLAAPTRETLFRSPTHPSTARAELDDIAEASLSTTPTPDDAG